MTVRSPLHKLTLGHRKGPDGVRVPTGWQKKIKGRAQWICPFKDAPTPEIADAFYEKNFTEIWADVPTAVPTLDEATAARLSDLMNVFLDRKRKTFEIKKRSGATYREYEEALQMFLDVVGGDGQTDGLPPARVYIELTTGHFDRFALALSKRFGPDRAKKFNIMVRSLFKWAAKPPFKLTIPDYGDSFALPSKKEFRLHRKATREKDGAKLFDAKEVRAQIKHASTTLKAMILLGLNAGFGNTDLAELPLTVVDLRTHWIEYQRGKTGADRKAWLWDETIKAIKKYLTIRPEPALPEFAHLLFLTSRGHPFVRDKTDVEGNWTSRKDGIGQAYVNFLKSDALEQYTPGRNFYSLRRTYRTVAFEVGKEMVIDLTMGHCEDAEDMSRVYTMSVLDDELKKIAAHVRKRLIVPESPVSRRPSKAGAAKTHGKRARARRASLRA